MQYDKLKTRLGRSMYGKCLPKLLHRFNRTVIYSLRPTTGPDNLSFRTQELVSWNVRTRFTLSLWVRDETDTFFLDTQYIEK